MDEEEKALEEWKITRSTIVELTHIMSNIRTLDVTATMVLIGAGFEYSYWLFLIAAILNFSFFLLEKHYHNYVYAIAKHAIQLERKFGFKLTDILDSTRNRYKKEKRLSFKFVEGFLIAEVYYTIYVAFTAIGLILFIIKISKI